MNYWTLRSRLSQLRWQLAGAWAGGWWRFWNLWLFTWKVDQDGDIMFVVANTVAFTKYKQSTLIRWFPKKLEEAPKRLPKPGDIWKIEFYNMLVDTNSSLFTPASDGVGWTLRRAGQMTALPIALDRAAQNGVDKGTVLRSDFY